MGHTDNNHVEIQKPVAFYAPLISGLIVILIILLIIGLFNPTPHSEEHSPDSAAVNTHATHDNPESTQNHTTGDNH
ncbi:MAG: hypothetical protein N3F09_01250 [Bacteroidia bacterium]|nr:hypothetical protein [Bacteroidia bacterium]